MIDLAILEPYISLVSARIAHNPAFDRDDVKQELRLAAFKALRSCDETRGSTIAYLRKVISNRMIDLLRKARTAKIQVPFEEVAGIPDQDVAQRMDLEEIFRALPPRCKRACRLLAQGKSISAIAEAEGCARETFRRRVIVLIQRRLEVAGYKMSARDFAIFVS